MERSSPRPPPGGGSLPGPSRRRVFAVLTVLLPVAVVLLMEAGLRLGGFGHTYPLFVPDRRQEDWLKVNPQVVRRFLADEAESPKLWIRPVPFRREKRPGTFRIFIQGGSTAEGYPYGYGASPAGMLQQRLQRTFPRRRIEVITTAMSAVNTYTLLDFSREILAQEPDAVVIYAGHNEYLGLLGVGSSFSAGRRRPLVLAFLRLKDLRLLQLGRRTLAALRPAAEIADRRSLMERVVAEDRIPYRSGLFRRGLGQYRANLRTLLRRYREAGVPVFLGTVVSNEKDQPPFLSGHAPGVDFGAWQSAFDTGRRALAEGEPAAASEAFEDAVALDDIHADGHFGYGRALEALGRYGRAREAYIAAKDRDELRFRAPEEINLILREVAAQQGARVVEVRQAFRRNAEHGIVGRDLMLEHLHPNLEGYFLLADAFYDEILEAGILGPPPPRRVSDAEARREVPVTEVDRLYGEYRVGKLTAGWPFSQRGERYRLPRATDPVERIAQALYRGSLPWPDAMRRLLDYHRSRGEITEAARVAVLIADAFPFRRDDQLAAAELLRRAGRPDSDIYRRLAAAADPGP